MGECREVRENLDDCLMRKACGCRLLSVPSITLDMYLPEKTSANAGIASVLLLLVVYFGMTLIQSFHLDRLNNQRLVDLQQQVDVLTQRRDQLKDAVSASKTDAFIEREARNHLGLARPGDIVVIDTETSRVLASKTENVARDERLARPLPGAFADWVELLY
jgi:cell division protein FtsB